VRPTRLALKRRSVTATWDEVLVPVVVDVLVEVDVLDVDVVVGVGVVIDDVDVVVGVGVVIDDVDVYWSASGEIGPPVLA
jgi:hypothetical protein